MKAILEFNLDEREDINRHRTAVQAEDMRYVLDEVWEQLFRPNNKHGYNSHNEILNSEEAYEIIEEMQKIYINILEDYNITLRSE